MQRSKALEFIHTYGTPELTSAERAVARTIIQDMPIKVAAEHLGLSTRTIENHRLNIRKKNCRSPEPIEICVKPCFHYP